MKKLFASLMIGFGAALGVFVALAMPPGGWGVAIGVGLGLLGCIPLLLVLLMLIGRGNSGRHVIYETPSPEPVQPIIIFQQMPPAPEAANYGYFEANPGYGYSVTPEYQNGYAGGQPAQLAPSRRRRRTQELPPQAPEYYPNDYYYNQPGYDQYQSYQQPYQYEAPPPQPQQYDAYYGPPVRNQPNYGYAAQPEYYEEDEYEAAPAVQPGRREAKARPAQRPTRSRRPAREETVEGEYRTIGEGE